MPPKLMAPERRPAGRVASRTRSTRSRSLVRRCASRSLSRPRPDEEPFTGAEAAGRSPRRSRRRAPRARISGCAGICTSSTRPSPCRCGCSPRKSHLERVGRWLARQEQELQVRLARELVARCRSLDRDDRRARPGARAAGGCDRAGVARAAGLRRDHGREAARRDRPDRPLQDRRAARPPQRRRTAGSELRPDPTPPARPRRQPPTQRRALPDRDHASPLPPRARAYLERKQAEGKSRREAIRCLKRLLVRVVFNTLKASPALT